MANKEVNGDAAVGVKYLLLPLVVVKKEPDDITVAEGQEIVRGYLADGFTIIATHVTNIGPTGMTVAHVLVK